MAQKRTGNLLTLIMLIGMLLALGWIALLVLADKKEAEAGYLGIYAATESVTVATVVTDSLGAPADPDSARYFWYRQGTAFDSTENIQLVKPTPGLMWFTRKAGNATNQTGTYTVAKKVYIQGREVWARDNYQVADTTLGYEADPTAAIGVAAITPADCDTVKSGGVPIAGAWVIVTHSSDKTNPLYWGKTDGDGDFTVYVPTGATYYVRPIYQGVWLDEWCEVSK